MQDTSLTLFLIVIYFNWLIKYFPISLFHRSLVSITPPPPPCAHSCLAHVLFRSWAHVPTLATSPSVSSHHPSPFCSLPIPRMSLRMHFSFLSHCLAPASGSLGCKRPRAPPGGPGLSLLGLETLLASQVSSSEWRWVPSDLPCGWRWVPEQPCPFFLLGPRSIRAARALTSLNSDWH